MKISYFGHSCFSVEVAGKILLFDPFIRPNELAKHIDVNSVKSDYILVSHGHWDHIDDAVDLAKKNGSTIISNYEIAEWLGKKGATKTHAMNHGGAWQFEFGRVKLVNAIHSSSMPDGTYGGNPGGFVIEADQGSFYYSGDTAWTMDMKLIGDSTSLAFAVLCIGDNFTMGVDDAIKAAEFVRSDQIIGVHYDTFPPIRIDHDEARRKFKAAGKELHLIRIGEAMTI